MDHHDFLGHGPSFSRAAETSTGDERQQAKTKRRLKKSPA
jgi:hypothetical protein